MGGCVPKIESIRYISLDGYAKNNADARVVERARGTWARPHFFIGKIPTRYEVARKDYTLVFEVRPSHSRPGIILNVLPYPEYRIGFHTTVELRPEPCVRWTWDENKPGEWFFSYWCDKKDSDGHIDMHLLFTVFDQGGAVVAEEAIPYTVEWNGFFGYVDAI